MTLVSIFHQLPVWSYSDCIDLDAQIVAVVENQTAYAFDVML